jgi:polyhydroxyalkanoate synthesis regulator phasin
MEVEKAQSTWMDQVEREIERLLEDLYKLYERSVAIGYSANELKSVVREIERHIDDVEDAIQTAQALLQRLR